LEWGQLRLKFVSKKRPFFQKKRGVHFKIAAIHFIFKALLFEIGPVLFISSPILLEIEAVRLVLEPILLAKKGLHSRQKLHAFGENGHSSRAEGGVGETMRRWNATQMEGNIANAVEVCRLWTSGSVHVSWRRESDLAVEIAKFGILRRNQASWETSVFRGQTEAVSKRYLTVRLS